MVPRWLTAIILFAVLGYGLFALRAVLTPVFFAFLIAYMLDPLVDRLEAMGLGRGLGIAALLGAVLAGLAVFIILLVPTVARELAEFAQELPARAAALAERLETRLASVGIDVSAVFSSGDEAVGGSTIEGYVRQFEGEVREFAGSAAGPVAQGLSYLLGGAFSLVGALLGLLMIPVFLLVGLTLQPSVEIVGVLHLWMNLNLWTLMIQCKINMNGS